jgi:hypothetical protein
LEELNAVKTACTGLITEQRRYMPNTYKSIHTVIAFRVLVDEYKHRLKKGYEMGCLGRKMQQAVETRLEERIVRRRPPPHPTPHTRSCSSIGSMLS